MFVCFYPFAFQILVIQNKEIRRCFTSGSRKGLAETTLGSSLPRARTWVATPLHTGGIASVSNTGRGRGGGVHRITARHPQSQQQIVFGKGAEGLAQPARSLGKPSRPQAGSLGLGPSLLSGSPCGKAAWQGGFSREQ